MPHFTEQQWYKKMALRHKREAANLARENAELKARIKAAIAASDNGSASDAIQYMLAILEGEQDHESGH